MQLHRHSRTLLLSVALLAFGAPPRQNALHAQEHFAVIVDPGSTVTDISLPDLRRIYLGELQFWPDGRRIVLLLPAKGTPARGVALTQIYGFGEAELNRYLIAKTFRNVVASGPKLVSTAAMALRLVADIPGAIAIVPMKEAGGASKVLTIDGHRPGTPGYPLTRRGS